MHFQGNNFNTKKQIAVIHTFIAMSLLSTHSHSFVSDYEDENDETNDEDEDLEITDI